MNIELQPRRIVYLAALHLRLRSRCSATKAANLGRVSSNVQILPRIPPKNLQVQ